MANSPASPPPFVIGVDVPVLLIKLDMLHGALATTTISHYRQQSSPGCLRWVVTFLALNNTNPGGRRANDKIHWKAATAAPWSAKRREKNCSRTIDNAIFFCQEDLEVFYSTETMHFLKNMAIHLYTKHSQAKQSDLIVRMDLKQSKPFQVLTPRTQCIW